AMPKLKRGMELVLLGGNYGHEILITEDGIIISSEGDEQVIAPLRIKSKSCIVRNYYGSSIHTDNDLIIVNSVFIGVRLSAEKKKKTTVSIYNSAFTSLMDSGMDASFVYYGNDAEGEFRIRNCNMVGGSYETLVRCYPPIPVSIENSILFSGAYVFKMSSYQKEKAKLTLKDNIMFGKNGIGVSNSGKNQDAPIYDPKELKKIGSVTLYGKNDVVQLKFEGGIDRFSPFSGSNLSENILKFIPKNPEAEGKGVIADKNPFFKKALENPPPSEEKSKQQILPLRKKRSNSQKNTEGTPALPTDEIKKEDVFE
nr:hypothetical protein [Victivallales bacterium]